MVNEIFRKGFALLILFCSLSFGVKLRDIASFEGNRGNFIVGYGLVVGLNGTGDTRSTFFTVKSLTNALQKMGIVVDPRRITVRNVAAVIVTARVPPSAKAGMTVDVDVASIGDARSLEGGTLILTPLKGPDGKIYALAQGQVIVGGYEARGLAGLRRKNVTTVGRIPNGAILERDIPSTYDMKQVHLYLNNPNFSTAKAVVDAINSKFGENTAVALDATTIRINIPENENYVSFLAQIEDIDVDIPVIPKVVIDSRTGTIVFGGDVTIKPVAVAVGSLTVKIKETPEVSQPQPFAGGQTQVVPRTQIQVQEEGKRLVQIKGAKVSELVESLNRIGATPREIISILQAIKSAGALNAKLEVL